MNRESANELLFCCLNDKLSASRSDWLIQQSDSDWNEVLEQSELFGIMPLVYHRLHSQHLDSSIPANVMQTLRTKYLITAGVNTRLYCELAMVLEALNNENIQVIILKGAYLAEFVYESIAIRPMGDIDILIKKNDLLKAEKKLIEMGYNLFHEYALEKTFINHHHLPPLIKSGAFPIEIHWTIGVVASSVTIDINGLWERALPAKIVGVNALSLSLEDLLLHLCLHLTQLHFFDQGVRILCDIHETIRNNQEQIDWIRLEYLASQWGVKKPVYLTFRLAKEFLDTHIPDEFLINLSPDGINKDLLVFAKEQLLSQKMDYSNMLRTLSPNEYGVNYFDRIVGLLNRIFSPEYVANRYNLPKHSWKIYCYYPIRLMALLLEYGYKLACFFIYREEKVKHRNKYDLEEWLKSKS